MNSPGPAASSDLTPPTGLYASLKLFHSYKSFRVKNDCVLGEIRMSEPCVNVLFLVYIKKVYSYLEAIYFCPV